MTQHRLSPQLQRLLTRFSELSFVELSSTFSRAAFRLATERLKMGVEGLSLHAKSSDAGHLIEVRIGDGEPPLKMSLVLDNGDLEALTPRAAAEILRQAIELTKEKEARVALALMEIWAAGRGTNRTEVELAPSLGRELDRMSQGWASTATALQQEKPTLTSLQLTLPAFGSTERPDLNYVFSDGTQVKSRLLLSDSRLRSWVHRDLLPRIPSLDAANAEEWEQATVGVIRRALVHQEDLGFELVATSSDDSGAEILPIREFSTEAGSGLDLTVTTLPSDPAPKGVGRARFDVRPTTHSGGIRLFSRYRWDPPGKIALHHLDEIRASLTQAGFAPGLEKMGHEPIRLTTVQFEKAGGDALGKAEHLPKLKRADTRDWKGVLDISANSARLGVQGPDFSVWNLPNTYKKLWSGLNAGFEAVLEPRYLRDTDLIAFKHRGLYAYLTYEAWNLRLTGQTTRGTAVKNTSLWWDELSRTAVRLLKQTQGTLELLISKSLIDEIRAYLDLIIQGDNLYTDLWIYREEETVHLRGMDRWYGTLYTSLIKALFEQSLGDCFARPRGQHFPEWSAVETPLCESQSIEDAATLPFSHGDREVALPRRVWLELQERYGFVLTLEGKPVELLNAQTFQASFELLETGAGMKEAAEKTDWFELNPRVFLNGTEVSADVAQKLLLEGLIEHEGKFYQLNRAELPHSKALEQFWLKLMGPVGAKRKGAKLSRIFPLARHQTLELLALRAMGYEVKGGKEWKELCDFYDKLNEPRDPLATPLTIHGELKPYQRHGVTWLHDLHRLKMGAILADEMGLGKTLQTLAFFEHLRNQRHSNPQLGLGHALVVVPTSLVHNWIAEVKKFAPELAVFEFSSREKAALPDWLKTNKDGVIISTYGLLMEHFEALEKVSWNICVFDEAQYLKTITAGRTTCARKLKAQFKICLTGTPLENHLGELYSLTDLIMPGSLGDLTEFRRQFVKAEFPDPDLVSILKRKIRPLVMRRTKSTILSELPPKTEVRQAIPFEERQKSIYRDIAISWNERVQKSIAEVGESRSQIEMLTALLRLRQICSDPAGVPDVSYSTVPPKVELLMDALEEITESGDSALIFTQFLATFHRIEKEAKARGIPLFILHGAMPQSARREQIDGFTQFPKGAVFLSTLKSGGTGLNLTKASYVFHVEPWWNPAVENQATDRTHRIGQTKPITVYRYVMEDSVEEKIEQLKERKAQRFQMIFTDEETENAARGALTGGAQLSREDFEYLVGNEK